MSRSGYVDECEDILAYGRWRGVVKSATNGKRGQAFLKELLESLEAMPVKRLIRHELRKDGEMCTLGAIGAKRGVNLETIDPDDHEVVAAEFGIANPLAREIVFYNDEVNDYCTPEERWSRMRAWVKEKIKEKAAS